MLNNTYKNKLNNYTKKSNILNKLIYFHNFSN